MKIRIRFKKKGIMMFVGHLDIMRFFQKLFRRCGFDVAYSQGFSPHQLISFASPLGLGITTIADYMDVEVVSFAVTDTCTDSVGKILSINDWIKRLNAYSNGYITITGIYLLGDKTKPSMSLLSACSYVISNLEHSQIQDIIKYFNESNELIYTKMTKKSVKEIDLKTGILGISDSLEKLLKLTEDFAVNDVEYLKNNSNEGLFIMCISGSELNIKPEMLIELYNLEKNTNLSLTDYDIERIEMYTKKDERYISMAIDRGF